MKKIVQRKQRNPLHQATQMELARTDRPVWDGALQEITESDAAGLTAADQPYA